MKYLCLGYHDEQTWANLPTQQRDELLRDTFAYQDELQRTGHFLDGQALKDVHNAATLRFRSGEVIVTDGPFAETKEQLGGVMVLDARDLNHAIQLMSKLPCMKVGGSLEIRPIDEKIGAGVEIDVCGSTKG